jgi:phosphohistidine phosphatase
MKTLYLVRHAKSSWDDITLDDIDRPLKAIGVSDAYLIASKLKDQNIIPELIISSPATRALSTAIIFARVLNYPLNKISIREEVYESSPEEISNVLNEQPLPSSIMIFGHDPSLSQLYNRLSGNSIEKIPTCGVATIIFEDAHWKDILNLKGEGISLTKPKDFKSLLNKG